MRYGLYLIGFGISAVFFTVAVAWFPSVGSDWMQYGPSIASCIGGIKFIVLPLLTWDEDRKSLHKERTE